MLHTFLCSTDQLHVSSRSHDPELTATTLLRDSQWEHKSFQTSEEMSIGVHCNTTEALKPTAEKVAKARRQKAWKVFP